MPIQKTALFKSLFSNRRQTRTRADEQPRDTRHYSPSYPSGRFRTIHLISNFISFVLGFLNLKSLIIDLQSIPVLYWIPLFAGITQEVPGYHSTPLWPKPPSPRGVSSSTSTSAIPALYTLVTTIWAIRSPLLMVNGFSPQLIMIMPISPL